MFVIDPMSSSFPATPRRGGEDAAKAKFGVHAEGERDPNMAAGACNDYEVTLSLCRGSRSAQLAHAVDLMCKRGTP